MHRRAIVLGAAAAAGLAACSRQQEKTAETATPAAPDPAAVVRAIYEPYLIEGGAIPEFSTRPWSADLRARLDAMMARAEARNEPILDADPVIDGQDYQLSNLNVTTDGIVENSHATVRASFANLGRPTEVVYDLIWEDGGWRIDNIRTSAWDLRQIASQ